MTEALRGGFRLVRNVTYATRGGRVLQGDLYVPPPDPRGATPGVLVVVHGGGWEECVRRRDVVARYALAMAQELRVGVFNIEYRLTQEGGGYPESLGDVKCGIEWIAADVAPFGLDGARVAVAGESSGGQLAALAGVTANRTDLDPRCAAAPPAVVAVVSYSGPMDLPRLAGSTAGVAPFIRDYVGPCSVPLGSCDRNRSCDRCVDASPMAHACAASARFVLVQAPDAFDQIVPLAQAVMMRDALSAAGASVELVTPPEAQLRAQGCEPNVAARQAHGFSGCLTATSDAVVARVLQETIGP